MFDACFYATGHQIHCRFDKDHMAFASTLTWYHTHKQIHTQHTGAKHKYILTPYILFTAFICVTLNESLTDIKNLLYRGPQYLSKIDHLQKSHNCWLDSIRLSPSCKTQRILIEIM